MKLRDLFINKTLHPKKLYWRVLFSFLMMVLLIVLSTSLIFAAMYLGNVYRQLSRDSIHNVEKLAAEVDNEFKRFEDINLYLTKVPDVNAFLYSAAMDDYMTINRADIISRQVWSLSSFLYSIMIYNKDTGLTLMSGKLNIDKKQFFRSNPETPAVINSFNMIFSKVYPNGFINPPAETISMLFNDSEQKSIAGESAIVMTIDREELERKLLANIQGTTVLADQSGRILFSSNSRQLPGRMAAKPYFAKIRADAKDTDSFRIRINRGAQIVSYAKSRLTGFYVVNFRTPASYTDVIVKSEITIIAVSILVLIIFLLMGYFMSNRLYTPIRQITELFSGSKFGDGDNQAEEIATISKVFNRALQHISELESQSADHHNKLKEEFLRRLLRTRAAVETIRRELQDCQLNIELTALHLVCVKIDRYADMERNKKYAYETTLCSIIPEILGGEFRCETVNLFEGEIAVLLNFREAAPDECRRLIAAMDRVRETSQNTLHITLTVGIGAMADQMEDCPAAYQKAVEMVKHRFVLGLNHTIGPKLLEETLVTSATYPAEMADKLIKAIRLNRKEDFIETLQGIMGLLQHYSYPNAVSMSFQIISECIKAINHLTQQDSTRYFLNLDDFSNILNSLETLEQIKDWLIGLFTDYQGMLEQINQLKNSKHYHLVEKMQEHIKLNYRDCNLNVESIAGMAGYTSYYFSKIFKELTGMNVVDYIKQIRINKAKELLRNEEIKVSDIPELIGFTNSGHFYSTFKKDVGLTPSAYREYVLNR